MAVLGRVRGPNGFDRPVTDDDALWAARMLLGESGHYAWDTNEGYAVMWTMLNRWVQTARILPYLTFGEFIQRYSRAINPTFLHGGSRDTDPTQISDNEQRRTVRRGLGWRELPPRLHKVVYDVLQGRVAAGPYAGLVHYDMPGRARPEASWIGPVSLPGVPSDSNEFYRMQATSGWTPSTVVVRSEATRSTVQYAGLGFGVGLLAVGILASTQFQHEAIKKWRKPVPPQKGRVHRDKSKYERTREKQHARREGW